MKDIALNSLACKKQNDLFKSDNLAGFSSQGQKWDTKRLGSECIIEILDKLNRFPEWSFAIKKCASIIWFNNKIQLVLAHFCHKRHCFVCDWRKSLMYYAKFTQFLPNVLSNYPKERFVFLTLTVPNVRITNLRPTLISMSKAWNKLIMRKEFRLCKGFIRKTEVTCEKNRTDFAHPHFHCLLMVSPSWFTKDYTSQQRWSAIWKECMKLDEMSLSNKKGPVNYVKKGPLYVKIFMPYFLQIYSY